MILIRHLGTDSLADPCISTRTQFRAPCEAAPTCATARSNRRILPKSFEKHEEVMGGTGCSPKDAYYRLGYWAFLRSSSLVYVTLEGMWSYGVHSELRSWIYLLHACLFLSFANFVYISFTSCNKLHFMTRTGKDSGNGGDEATSDAGKMGYDCGLGPAFWGSSWSRIPSGCTALLPFEMSSPKYCRFFFLAPYTFAPAF